MRRTYLLDHQNKQKGKFNPCGLSESEIQCGAYAVYARSPSPSQRPAPTTIASRGTRGNGDISEARSIVFITSQLGTI